MVQLVMNVFSRAVSDCLFVVGRSSVVADDDHILCPPYKSIKHLEPELHTRIANYLGQVLGKRTSKVKRHFGPQTQAYSAGKLRIRNGGDNFRTKLVSRWSGRLERRNYYIRV